MALWGGRFSHSPAQSAFALSRSIDFDWRLAPYDLRASMAHCSLLEGAQLLSPSDAQGIRAALKELTEEVSKGTFLPIPSDEDVHSALERGLTKKLGSLGGVLRAGRSRNDQVSTDLRLYAIDHLLEIAQLLTQLQISILAKSGEYVDAPAPGFTHLQHAQPVSFGHELAKHIHAFARDIARIKDWWQRAAVSPLRSGAAVTGNRAAVPRQCRQHLPPPGISVHAPPARLLQLHLRLPGLRQEQWQTKRAGNLPGRRSGLALPYRGPED